MKSSHGKLGGLILALTLAAATAMSPLATADKASSSGFLPAAVEANLQKETLENGAKVERWISPELANGKYSAIMIDRAIFFPAPNPGPQISSSTLENISDHLTSTLRVKVNEKVPVVDQAGPGVLRIQPAISSLAIKKEGLSAKDILPVHLVFSAASAASGKMDMDVTLNLEVRVTDSVSGDYRIAVKRGLVGEQLGSKNDMLGLDDMRKALDTAASDAAQSLHNAMTE